MSAFPTPEVIIPAVMNPILLGRSNRREGPVRKVPTVKIKQPKMMIMVLFIVSGMKIASEVTMTTAAVKLKKKTPISCSV